MWDAKFEVFFGILTFNTSHVCIAIFPLILLDIVCRMRHRPDGVRLEIVHVLKVGGLNSNFTHCGPASGDVKLSAVVLNFPCIVEIRQDSYV